ncbi:MAG: DUF885 domain-containing protein [Gammaproteobacteria bacterium]|nr:DUF885 domain-containing protein [Gammaproteobacteria bacterium]
MRISGISAILIIALAACTPAPETSPAMTAESRLQTIIDEHWAYSLSENPLMATQAGVSDYNHQLPRVTVADRERRLAAEQDFLKRLQAIDPEALGADQRINHELLEWVLQDSIQAYELELSRIPFNTFWGFYMAVLSMTNGLPTATVEDYEDYIARLNDIPRYFSENVDNMRDGIRTGFTLPRIVMEGILPTIEAQIFDNPEESSFYDPFANMGDGIPEADQARLLLAGRKAISGSAISAFAELAAFFKDEYLAAATTTLGAEQLPDGKAYYAHQIVSYATVTDQSSTEIHNIGLGEVTRIRAEMDALIAGLKFDGDFAAFTEFLRTDPQFYANSSEELLKEAAYTAKRIDYLMPGFFGKLPRLSYGVVPVPDEVAPNYTTAAYVGPPIGGTVGGAYWVNTYALDQRPLYELTALTLHEAVPGHHHQGALSQELEDMPDFRRNLYISAFGEGWGLYAEKLGVEMGVYRSPYENFGRLSYEMWRACRLVIDTGLHSQGWSRDQAMEYLADNTSLSRGNVRSEVDRYISWPAQALSYKLGELKIWELRRRAEEALGDDFDLREFHDVLLGDGALPLSMLENVIDRYIAKKGSN